MLHICSYCVYMEKTKHPIVRIDSDIMDDLEKICNVPGNKISKASFTSYAIREKIDREEKQNRDIIVKEFFDHYRERSSDYYEKGIKNKDEYFAHLVLKKDVLEIGKAQKKLEKEVKEYQDVTVYALDALKKLVNDTKEKVKTLQIT